MIADDLQHVVGEWGERTFPEATPVTILSHLHEEVAELDHASGAGSAPGVREECADVYLMLLHLAHRGGFSLHDAAVAKLGIVQGQRFEMTEQGYRKRVKEPAPVGPPAPGGMGET